MTNQTNSETKQVNKISINEIFKLAVRLDASDILIKVGSPPVFRINGKLLDLKKVLQSIQVKALNTPILL